MKKIIITILCFCFFFLTGFTFDEEICSYQIKLPVVMYHSILNSKTGTYIVSQTQLENDIKTITNQGYTTVFPSEVIDFVYNNTPLPTKPILITFDDGYYNNLYYGLDVFKKYNAKANINIIGALADKYSQEQSSNPNYSYLTWEQIKYLDESGHFEIGNHSYDMHKFSPRYGIDQMGCESDEDYFKALNIDISTAEQKLYKKANIKTEVFAYPFGQYNDLSETILKQREYKICLTCYEKTNIIEQGNKACLLNLGRINRSGGMSTTTLLEKIKNYS